MKMKMIKSIVAGAALCVLAAPAMALEVGVRHTTGHQDIHIRNGVQTSTVKTNGHIREESTRDGATIFAKDFEVDGTLKGTQRRLEAGRHGFEADGILDVSAYTNSRSFRGSLKETATSTNTFSGSAGSRFTEVSSFAR
jgi:hypothetical protein